MAHFVPFKNEVDELEQFVRGCWLHDIRAPVREFIERYVAFRFVAKAITGCDAGGTFVAHLLR